MHVSFERSFTSLLQYVLLFIQQIFICILIIDCIKMSGISMPNEPNCNDFNRRVN